MSEFSVPQDANLLEQWPELRKRILSHAKLMSAKQVFGSAAQSGGVYRWGISTATGMPISKQLDLLSRLASGQRQSKKVSARTEIGPAVADLRESTSNSDSLVDLAYCNVLAAAMPSLTSHLPQDDWWSLLGELQSVQRGVFQTEDEKSPAYVLAAELGLTLAWRLVDLPSCKRLHKESAEHLSKWFAHEEDAIGAALKQAVYVRLIAASLIRCEKLLATKSKRKLKKSSREMIDDLAIWVASTTTSSGTSAFSASTRPDVADDTKKDGLLDHVVQRDPSTLKPAMQAALGKETEGGRLAWEIALPETLQVSEEGSLAVLMPEWDVRRGRTHIDFSGNDTSIEIFGGKSCVVGGLCQTSLSADGQNLKPLGHWVSNCEYSDDDVNFLEIEQPWSGGFVLQRQFLLVRDDRCVFFADSILPSDSSETSTSLPHLEYEIRIPLMNSVNLTGEPDTREMFLSDGKKRGLVIPLAANEWRIGPSAAKLSQSDDQYLSYAVTGKGQLYAPIWMDFQRRRFRLRRTWRQLTVADELRICESHEAVGFRIQVATEQWLIYRSLANRTPRTVLGKHVVADFYAGRFHASDGSIEELITVDDSDTDDE